MCNVGTVDATQGNAPSSAGEARVFMDAGFSGAKSAEVGKDPQEEDERGGGMRAEDANYQVSSDGCALQFSRVRPPRSSVCGQGGLELDGYAVLQRHGECGQDRQVSEW